VTLESVRSNRARYRIRNWAGTDTEQQIKAPSPYSVVDKFTAAPATRLNGAMSTFNRLRALVRRL